MLYLTRVDQDLCLAGFIRKAVNREDIIAFHFRLSI